MKCSKIRERLSLYIDGALDEMSTRELEKHTAECSECAQELSVMRMLVDAAHEVEMVEPPTALRADILTAVRELQPETWLRRTIRMLTAPTTTRWAAGVSAAAVIAAAVIVNTPRSYDSRQSVSVERQAPISALSANISEPADSGVLAEAQVAPPRDQVASGTRRIARDRNPQHRPDAALAADEPVDRRAPVEPPRPPAMEEPVLTAERPEQLTEIEAAPATDSHEPAQVAVAPAPALPAGESSDQPTLMKVASAPVIDEKDYEEWFARVKDQASMRTTARKNVSVNLFSARF